MAHDAADFQLNMIAELPEIQELLDRVQRPPGEQLPLGASEENLDKVESSLGLRFPSALREWLKTTNGPCVGPGGLFGINTARPSLDIANVLSIYPEWRDKGFIPVASDGCGNYYVLAMKFAKHGEAPVVFVDTGESLMEPAYIVASSLGRFLWFFLKKEHGETIWPFRQKEVLAADPELINCGGFSFPWES